MSDENTAELGEITEQDQSDAKALYDACGEQAGWRNFTGAPMPMWADLGERIQGCWVATARAARTRFADQTATRLAESDQGGS